MWRSSLVGGGVAPLLGVVELIGWVWHNSLVGCGVAHFLGVA